MLVAAGVLIGLALSLPGLLNKEQRWEYNYLKIYNNRDMQTLYDMGDQGWEVAGLMNDAHGTRQFLLKRHAIAKAE